MITLISTEGGRACEIPKEHPSHIKSSGEIGEEVMSKNKPPKGTVLQAILLLSDKLPISFYRNVCNKVIK